MKNPLFKKKAKLHDSTVKTAGWSQNSLMPRKMYSFMPEYYGAKKKEGRPMYFVTIFPVQPHHSRRGVGLRIPLPSLTPFRLLTYKTGKTIPA